MKDMAGFGLVGNFAYHLEQAGEAAAFAHIKSDAENAPKGIFPFYIPESSGILGRYCIDNTTIILPQDTTLNVQAEPEVGLECEICYNNGYVSSMRPHFFMAFNDTSVRNDSNAIKISQKKNFSYASKGMGAKIALDTFDRGGICDRYWITSFICSENNVLEVYGENSPLLGYSYFYKKLLDWIVRTLNTQEDLLMLEYLRGLLAQANYPKRAIFTIGATRYMPDKEKRFLRPNDKVYVVVYDHSKYSLCDIQEIAQSQAQVEGISLLCQRVVRD